MPYAHPHPTAHMQQENTFHTFPPQPPRAPPTTPAISAQNNVQVTPPQQPKQPQTPHTQPTNISQTTPTTTQHTPTQPAQHVVPHKMQVSEKWTPNTDCYDSCTNLGGPVYRTIQATAWSTRKGLQGQDAFNVPYAALTRYGVEDYSVRLLSQGKFTGVVATRSVAESVFLSQMVKALREHNIDLDSAAEASHKGPAPSKTSDPLRFFEPLIQSVLEDIRSKVPPETSLEQIHKLADTEAQLAKAQQKLQQHGIQMTPQRSSSNTPALPTQNSGTDENSQPVDTQADAHPDDSQPAYKKARKAKTKPDKPDTTDKMDMDPS